jgi:feruloyl esterase
MTVSLATLPGCASPSPDPVSCEGLTALTLDNGRVTQAKMFTAGEFAPPEAMARAASAFENLPAFCQVAGTLAPTAQSEINIEVWLPVTGWNGKFLAVGNGGWSGSVSLDQLADGLRRGYATAGTDTGHQGGGGPWMRQREKLIDYGYRAIHETTVASRAISAAFYAREPRLSYFTGCSGGGRQGLKAAQQYPDDFDGIVAGAPALDATGRAAFSIWAAQNMHRSEASYIPPAKYPAIHEAVLQACDGLDGVRDGVLEDPRACTFDPSVLACSANDSSSCLTPPQVDAARMMYAPLNNPRTGENISPGLVPGSELGWGTFGGPQPFRLGMQMYQHMVFEDPDWDFRTLDFDVDMATVAELEGGIVNAKDPNLRPFAASGGKLLMYHGWSDPQIPALHSVGFYERVLDEMGGVESTYETARLFMMPGVNHCGRGGPGMTTFDMLAALEAWVELGEAPDRIVASREVDGHTERTRPLCPYPQVATYTGSGSTDEAANFECRLPER